MSLCPPFQEAAFLPILTSLVAAPGKSGCEGPRIQTIRHHLTEAGLVPETDAAGNLTLGFGSGPWEETVVVDAHVDVVGEGCGNVRITEETITGPGVADDLAAATMIILLAKTFQEKKTGFRRPVCLLFSVGEEGEGNLAGIRHFTKTHPVPPFAMISLDLDMDHVSVSGVGSRRYRIITKGPGGHSWGDWESPNAIAVLCKILTRIHALRDPDHTPVASRLTTNIGRMEGGEGINAIARSASATFEFRSVDPARLQKADAMLQKECAMVPPPVTISLSDIGSRPAALPVHEKPLLNALFAVTKKQGITPAIRPISTNINATLAAGWPSLVTGICRCGNIHRPDEYLMRDSLPAGWQICWGLLQKLGVFS